MCTLGNESDIHGKKRQRAYFKAFPVGLKDTYGLDSHALAGTHSLERQERISWNFAKVSSWPISVSKHKANTWRIQEQEHTCVCCSACDPLEGMGKWPEDKVFLRKEQIAIFRNTDQDTGLWSPFKDWEWPILRSLDAKESIS